jgi:hypothetical protein
LPERIMRFGCAFVQAGRLGDRSLIVDGLRRRRYL